MWKARRAREMIGSLSKCVDHFAGNAGALARTEREARTQSADLLDCLEARA